jgi:hypothetical protein
MFYHERRKSPIKHFVVFFLLAVSSIRGESDFLVNPAPPESNAPAYSSRAGNAEIGIFYLKEQIKIASEAGIQNIKLGTEVRYLAKQGDKIQVTDGSTIFEVREDQVTVSMEERDALLANTIIPSAPKTNFDRNKMDKLFEEGTELMRQIAATNDRIDHLARQLSGAKQALAAAKTPGDKSPHREKVSYLSRDLENEFVLRNGLARKMKSCFTSLDEMIQRMPAKDPKALADYKAIRDFVLVHVNRMIVRQNY